MSNPTRNTTVADSRAEQLKRDQERETERRNEHVTNVEDKEMTDRERRLADVLQDSAKRIDGIADRLVEVAKSRTTNEREISRRDTEADRLAGLLEVELDYLRSIGKSPRDFFPEPPPAPELNAD